MSGAGSDRGVEAVVFDLDGTLIDSTGTYVRILNAAFLKVGLPAVTWDATVEAMRYGGFDWDKVLPGHLGERREAVVALARHAVMEIYPEAFRREAKMFPGAAETLRRVAESGFRVGLVTATQRMFLRDKLYPLKREGAAELLEVMITTDDVLYQKPAADPLLECARRLKVRTGGMVYVGDSRIDVRAGKAAGTLTVGVLTGVESRGALAAEGPDYILESVRDLEPLLEEWGRASPG